MCFDIYKDKMVMVTPFSRAYLYSLSSFIPYLSSFLLFNLWRYGVEVKAKCHLIFNYLPFI